MAPPHPGLKEGTSASLLSEVYFNWWQSEEASGLHCYLATEPGHTVIGVCCHSPGSSDPTPVGGRTDPALPVAPRLGTWTLCLFSSVLTELDTDSCWSQRRESPKLPPHRAYGPACLTPWSRQGRWAPPLEHCSVLQVLRVTPAPPGSDSAFSFWSKLPLGAPSRLFPFE